MTREIIHSLNETHPKTGRIRIMPKGSPEIPGRNRSDHQPVYDAAAALKDDEVLVVDRLDRGQAYSIYSFLEKGRTSAYAPHAQKHIAGKFRVRRRFDVTYTEPDFKRKEEVTCVITRITDFEPPYEPFFDDPDYAAPDRPVVGDDLVELARNGKKILAIKTFRERYDYKIGLKAAKEAVEAAMRDPEYGANTHQTAHTRIVSQEDLREVLFYLGEVGCPVGTQMRDGADETGWNVSVDRANAHVLDRAVDYIAAP